MRGGGTGLSHNSLARSPRHKRHAVFTGLKSYLDGLCWYYSILIGRIPSNHIRKYLMKHCFCMKLSKKAVLYGGFQIRSPWNIEVGDSVIGYGALLDGRSGIRIDDHVCLAVGVSIYTLQHDVNDEHFAVNQKGGSVEIEKYAWISSHTTVLPKVHVGEGCVLAAGGIATKNLEPYGVYAGIPARRISERNRCLHYTVGDTYCHFY